MESKWWKESMYSFWVLDISARFFPVAVNSQNTVCAYEQKLKHDLYFFENLLFQVLNVEIFPCGFGGFVFLDPSVHRLVSCEVHPIVGCKAVFLWQQYDQSHNSSSYILCHFNQTPSGIQVQKLDLTAGALAPFIINTESKQIYHIY